MSIFSPITKLFKSALPEEATTDRHEILLNLMRAQQYHEGAMKLLNLVKNNYGDKKTKYSEIAMKAYHEFSKKLPSSYSNMGLKDPFSDLIEVMESVSVNLEAIEENFPTLFVGREGKIDDGDLRASSLVVMGYVQMVEDLCTWTKILLEHLTAEANDTIPPFRTKYLTTHADRMASFATFNLTSAKSKGSRVIETVRTMQAKGVDAALKNGDIWIDSFVHDSQFSPMEKDMITASLLPFTMTFIHTYASVTKWWIDWNTANRDWLTAKVLFETEKLNGMDPSSSEFKRLKHAVDHYSDLISKYDQRLERARA